MFCIWMKRRESILGKENKSRGRDVRVNPCAVLGCGSWRWFYFTLQSRG